MHVHYRYIVISISKKIGLMHTVCAHKFDHIFGLQTVNVTEFAKRPRGLIHASNFATLKRHNLCMVKIIH